MDCDQSFGSGEYQHIARAEAGEDFAIVKSEAKFAVWARVEAGGLIENGARVGHVLLEGTIAESKGEGNV